MGLEIKNILVAGRYEEEFKEQLDTKKNFRFLIAEEITEKDLSWADAYVGFQPCSHFDLSKLKWVHSFNAGVNNFLEYEGWTEHQVLLTRTVCSFGQRISEYCLSYILRDLQHQSFFEKNQRQKNWVPKTPKMIKDETIVIFGTGDIGQELAKTFTQFGATVFGVSHSGKEKEFFQAVTKPSTAQEFIEKADWVISTLPLTSETKTLFNRHLFNHFDRAAFINVGRGATVDEEALIGALIAGKIRFAVLDVLQTEPLPRESPLWEREDIVITPHISAVTELNEAIECFKDTLVRIEQKDLLVNQVDFSKGY